MKRKIDFTSELKRKNLSIIIIFCLLIGIVTNVNAIETSNNDG